MVVYNRLIPFKGYKAINICGVVFARGELSEKDINHECIHSAQIIELLVVGFYLIYVLEWLWRVLFTKDRFSHKSYRNISFEKEAYAHEGEHAYLNHRKLFAMWR